MRFTGDQICVWNNSNIEVYDIKKKKKAGEFPLDTMRYDRFLDVVPHAESVLQITAKVRNSNNIAIFKNKNENQSRTVACKS